MANTIGEASTSRQKRQRVCGGDEIENIVVARSGTLLELDLLECPICCHSLTKTIFQCDNGHIACSGCCFKVNSKCAACTLPIGKYRSRIMERVVEAVTVTCGNAKLGCGDVVARSRMGTLFDLDLLDCPVCCNALKTPIFQCDNGHIACSSCCTKLRHKCTSCTLPIGNYRSRIMERVVEAIIVPCTNAKHGCTEKFSYGKEIKHEKKCSFALCYCPAPNCTYSGVCKDLYSHYAANHKNTYERFRYGYSHNVYLNMETRTSVLQEYFDGPLVVVQSFKEPQGLSVTVNCIAPFAPGVGEFSYDLSYSIAGNSMTFRSSEMNRIQKVSFQTPEKDFMLLPDYLIHLGALTKSTSICIRQRKEKEEEEEDDDDEDEDGED